MLEIKVSSLEDGQKIEKFVKKSLSEAPLGFIYKAFRKKDIKINGHWVKKDAVVKSGDIVRIYVTDEQLKDFAKPKEATKKPFPYEIVYEDENVLIVNKPAGLLVYGDEKEKRNTLTRHVQNYLYYKEEYNPAHSSFSPSPAHRLDRNTSGLVLFGKKDAALKELEVLFKERKDISKKYLALVAGKVNEEGEVDAPLLKDEKSGMVKVASISNGAKSAKTLYRPLEVFDDSSLVECDLLTGRTHQIRVHMAYISHPLLGDAKYGDFALNKIYREKYALSSQFLHAYQFEFEKIDGVLSYLSHRKFEAPLPKDREKILEELRAKAKGVQQRSTRK